MIYKLKRYMKKCENCENVHNGTYGSGRFCKSECSRSFSTRKNRKEINTKISIKLLEKRKHNDNVIKICSSCQCEFEIEYSKRNRLCCSKKCVGKLGGSAKKNDTSKMGGIREGGGRSKNFEYVNLYGESMKLNIEEIEIAKILDSSNLKWKRNYRGFVYLSASEETRKFYPDFYIEDIEIYIEYKGWLTDDMRHKMKESRKNIHFNLLIVVGNDIRFENDGMCINNFRHMIKNTEQLKEAAGLQNLA